MNKTPWKRKKSFFLKRVWGSEINAVVKLTYHFNLNKYYSRDLTIMGVNNVLSQQPLPLARNKN